MIEQTVFIIDDDDDVSDSIKELAESVGLKAKTFASALEFLEQFDNSCAGCIVLDVRMVGLIGLALQRKLKKMDAVIPVIFITAYADIPVVMQAFKDGAFDFFTKPYNQHSLLEVINSALQKDMESRITTLDEQV